MMITTIVGGANNNNWARADVGVGVGRWGVNWLSISVSVRGCISIGVGLGCAVA